MPAIVGRGGEGLSDTDPEVCGRAVHPMVHPSRALL